MVSISKIIVLVQTDVPIAHRLHAMMYLRLVTQGAVAVTLSSPYNTNLQK